MRGPTARRTGPNYVFEALDYYPLRLGNPVPPDLPAQSGPVVVKFEILEGIWNNEVLEFKFTWTMEQEDFIASLVHSTPVYSEEGGKSYLTMTFEECRVAVLEAIKERVLAQLTIALAATNQTPVDAQAARRAIQKSRRALAVMTHDQMPGAYDIWAVVGCEAGSGIELAMQFPQLPPVGTRVTFPVSPIPGGP